MQADYYREYYWLERNNWWFLARKKILLDQVRKYFPRKSDLKILNVGAALGASTVMLQEFGEVTSIEFNRECCEFVNEELKLNFIQGSITELPFRDNEFDMVCAFDVVEHVEDDRKAISELHRVCRQGGFTFTTVPAFKTLWSEHDAINEHVRRYTMKNFLTLFNDVNARIQFKSYYNFFLFPPVAIFRVISTLLKGKKEKIKPRSDNSRIKSNFISKILYHVFKNESFFLRRGIRFPVGISLMVLSRKL